MTLLCSVSLLTLFRAAAGNDKHHSLLTKVYRSPSELPHAFLGFNNMQSESESSQIRIVYSLTPLSLPQGVGREVPQILDAVVLSIVQSLPMSTQGCIKLGKSWLLR